MTSKKQILTTLLIFCGCLFPQTAAKTRRFRRSNTDFKDTVSFGRDLISFVSDEREESVVMTEKALIGKGEDNTIEIIVEIKDRVPMRGSRREPSIVLFFAPEDATLADVSRGFPKFEDYIVASLMDKSTRNSNSTSRFLSQSIDGETNVHEVDEEFSFLDSGFLKLTREDGFVKAYTSADQETWNQVGESEILPVELQEANMKAGLRVKRNSRDYYALSVDGKFSFSKFAQPVDDTIDTVAGQKVWDISIHVNKLCSDSTDGGLSTTLTNDLEYALLDFFNATYTGNQNITFDSVMILGDQFEEGISCDSLEESLEDSMTTESRRKLPRTLLYSTIYFILNGYCWGYCPSDPSSGIDTANRRKLQSRNEQLLGEIQSVAPDVDAVSKGEINQIDCTRNKNCNSQDGKCCGFDDCFCPYTVIEICDNSSFCRGPGCCRPAHIPKCEFAMTCDRTIDITKDKTTIVFGQSHKPSEFPRFRVYNRDSDNDKYYQHGILPFPNSTSLDGRSLNDGNSSKSNRVIASSVSISNDGQRVALGSNTGRKVKIFDLDTDDEWKDTKTFWGPHSSLFGQSVSLNPTTGNTIAIGSPRYTANNKARSGTVFVYQYENNYWSQLQPNIDGNIQYGELGWRVDVDHNNTVHAGYHKRSAVVSFKYDGNVWLPIPGADTDLKKCFSQSNNQCETNL